MTRINTNVASLVAIGRLRNNSNDLNTRLERLSTGLRINRGKDDPAGLIASETLRSEITGIRQAIENSSRAINVISTAEGALNEVSSLLLGLRSLVVSTANEGALSEEEVAANQLEIDSILASIDRIANTTEFSGKRLLNGNLEYSLSGNDTNALASIQTFAARVPEGSSRTVVIQVTASAQTAAVNFTGATTSAVTIEVAGNQGTDRLSFASGTTVATIATAVNDISLATGVSAVVSTVAAGPSAGTTALRLNSTEFGSDAFVRVKVLSGNFIANNNNGLTLSDTGVDPTVLVNGQAAKSDGLRLDIRQTTLDARFFLTPGFAQALSSTTYAITGGGSLFQISPDVSPLGQINVALNSVSTGNLGNSVVGFLDGLRSGGSAEVASKNFIAAERIITEAINQVAVMRGRLGSLQKNQIETNINSQQIALENVTASESIIRDADIASEVSALTRAQILVQATQVTLGLANSLPQQTLALLGA